MSSSSTETPRLFAVVDIGSHALRLALAEIDREGQVRVVEAAERSVAIGKDTFTTGIIGRSTTEACVRALTGFRRLLDEYGVDPAAQTRAVATSAVREARNRDAFLDRLFIATGFDIEPADEAEVNRYTYLSVRRHLQEDPHFRNKRTLVVDFGAGNTEVLLARGDEVSFAQTYQIGALRMQERLGDFSRPGQAPRLLLPQLDRTISLILREAPLEQVERGLLLGDSARFAARLLHPRSSLRQPRPLPLSALRKLAEEISSLSPDRIVRRYHLDYSDAEMLGAALLFYARLGDRLRIEDFLVTDAALRDGLLVDAAEEQQPGEEYGRQVLQSAALLASRYEVDPERGRFVAGVCGALFRALREEHRLSSRYELLLSAAALLHDIGLFVSKRSHHKHSMYLIRHSELFGLGAQQRLLVALIARYHRKAEPSPRHEGYDLLSRRDRIIVSQLAALLRLADALGEGSLRRAERLSFRLDGKRLLVEAAGGSDLSMERLALADQAGLFEKVYGRDVVLRPARLKER